MAASQARGYSVAMDAQDLAGRNAISVQELAGLRRAHAPHRILDVRELPELEICQLEGALHIPMSELPERIGEVPLADPVIVLCHHGVRSQMVVGLLRHAGWRNVVNLDGGIDAWSREVDTSLARY
jgi:rhodanese-related sulfurtransferase